jgi:hypothetical protein
MASFARNLIDFLVSLDTDSPEENAPAEPAPSGEPAVDAIAEEVKEPVKIRESTAIGNDKIEILRHDLYDVHDDAPGEQRPAGVDLAIQNLSESTIATAIIEVTFYDIEGNLLGTATHRVIELLPGTSRNIQIDSLVKEVEKVKSYDVRIVKTRTADAEKVQTRSHGMSRNTAGEEVVEGIVKNVSKVKTDAAVVISFFDANKEDVGRKILVLHDLEPEAIRRYRLVFMAPEGETVGTYSIVLGDMVE